MSYELGALTPDNSRRPPHLAHRPRDEPRQQVLGASDSRAGHRPRHLPRPDTAAPTRSGGPACCCRLGAAAAAMLSVLT